MLVISARSVATTEHFQQFMYSTVSKPEDGASCREQVVLLLFSSAVMRLSTGNSSSRV